MNQTATAEIQTEKPQTQKNENFDFFAAVREIACPLEYDFLPGLTFTFYFRLSLAKTEKEMRQNFAALTPEEKDGAREDYYLNLAASLTTRLPENVPGLEPKDGESLNETRARFREFFSDKNELKQKLLSDALDLYFARSQPREFFRRF